MKNDVEISITSSKDRSTVVGTKNGISMDTDSTAQIAISNVDVKGATNGVWNSGKLSIGSGTFTGDGYNGLSNSGGTVEIKDGEFIGATNGVWNSGTLVINGGVFRDGKDQSVYSCGSATLNSGSFTYVSNEDGTLSIAGGTYSGSVMYPTSIAGGTFNGSCNIGALDEISNCTINKQLLWSGSVPTCENVTFGPDATLKSGYKVKDGQIVEQGKYALTMRNLFEEYGSIIVSWKSGTQSGSNIASVNQDLVEGSSLSVTATAMANEGCSFVGWYADEDCTQLLSSEAVLNYTTDSLDAPVSIYAKFKDDAPVEAAEAFVSWYQYRSEFTINSVDDMNAFAYAVSNLGYDFSGKTVTLNTNLDFSDTTYRVVGATAEHPFKGTFNGGGKTISGISDIYGENFCGLFGVTNSARVMNLIVKNSTFACDPLSSSNPAKQGYAGGIVAEAQPGTVIEGCTVDTVTTSAYYSGSIMGHTFGGAVIDAVTVTGCNPGVNADSAALVGYSEGVTIRNAKVTELKSGAALIGVSSAGATTIEDIQVDAPNSLLIGTAGAGSSYVISGNKTSVSAEAVVGNARDCNSQTIEAGTFTLGGILKADSDLGSGKFTITGGTFTQLADEGSSSQGERLDVSSYLPEYWTQSDDGEVICERPAVIGAVAYESLEAAFAAAKDGDTITLTKDCNGNGIKVAPGTFASKGLTVDFAGYVYTVDGRSIGSSGTSTNGFQLRDNNRIVMKNGTITAGDNAYPDVDTPTWYGAAAIVVQNYSNLTLDRMTLNGGKNSVYTLSNNCGDTVIKDTTINVGQAAITSDREPFAFDVCGFSSYPSVSVTVEGDSVINGKVQTSKGSTWNGSAKLTITGGAFDSAFDAADGIPVAISGGTFSTDLKPEWLADKCGVNRVVSGNITMFSVVGNAIAQVYDENGEVDFAVQSLGLNSVTAAAKNGQTIKLLADTDGPLDAIVCPSNTKLTIDLNGHVYNGNEGEGRTSAVWLENAGADITIKNGTLRSWHYEAICVLAENCKVTLDGVSMVSNFSSNWDTGRYGIAANGIQPGVKDSSAGLQLKMANCSLTTNNTSASTVAVYFPVRDTDVQEAKLEIENCQITGFHTGVQAISGSVSISGDDTVVSTIATSQVENTSSDGPRFDGAAISIINRAGYGLLKGVSISSGKFTTASSDVEAIHAFGLNGNTASDFDNSDDIVKVSGGVFSSAVPAELCVDGYASSSKTDESGNTVYEVKSSITPYAALDLARGELKLNLYFEGIPSTYWDGSSKKVMDGYTAAVKFVSADGVSTESLLAAGQSGLPYGSVELWADDCTKEFTPTLVIKDAEGNQVFTYSYKSSAGKTTISAYDYLKAAYTSSNSSDALKNLLQAIATYDKYAYAKFTGGDYNVDETDLGFSFFDIADVADSLSAYSISSTPLSEGADIKVKGNSVVYRSTNAIRMYVEALPEGANSSDYVMGWKSSDATEWSYSELTTEDGHGGYYGSTDGITADNLDQSYDLAFFEENEAGYKQVSDMVTISVLAYANGVVTSASTDGKMKDLAKASYVYWKKAQAYFEEKVQA